jgi:hypothetical protein
MIEMHAKNFVQEVVKFLSDIREKQGEEIPNTPSAIRAWSEIEDLIIHSVSDSKFYSSFVKNAFWDIVLSGNDNFAFIENDLFDHILQFKVPYEDKPKTNAIINLKREIFLKDRKYAVKMILESGLLLMDKKRLTKDERNFVKWSFKYFAKEILTVRKIQSFY